MQVILAEELSQRLAEDEADHHRRARTLALHYTGGSGGVGSRPIAARLPPQQLSERSVRCPLPQYHGRDGPPAPAIAASAMGALRRLPDALPCVRLALAASDFSEVPLPGARAITSFFAPVAVAGSVAAHQEEQPGQEVVALHQPGPQEGAAIPLPSLQLSQGGAVAGTSKRPREAEAVNTFGSAMRPHGASEELPGSSRHSQPECSMIEGVDVEEQRRILRDIQLAGLKKKKKAEPKGGGKGAGQRSIADMFSKRA